MKVDLKELRLLIEEELKSVEKKKMRLQEQLEHIHAVEKLAEESRTRLQTAEETPEPVPREKEPTDQPRRWFQQT